MGDAQGGPGAEAGRARTGAVPRPVGDAAVEELDYLLAKIDAYADVDDRNHAALQADLAKRHETLEARFGAVEASGAELAADLRDLKKATPELEASLDEATTLLSKKLDYLQAKIDAYADADDGHHAASGADLAKRHETLEARLAAIETSGAELAGALAALREAGREEAHQRQNALDARLGAIEASGVELAGALAALRETGHEEAHQRQSALDARLGAIEASGVELAGALAALRETGHEEAHQRQNALDARLAAIETSGAEQAGTLAALREAAQEEARRRQDMLARLDAIEATQRDSAAKIGEHVDTTARKITKGVEDTAFNEFRQHEALDALRQLLKFDLPLPATRGWAASPDFLLHLYQHIATHRPKVVVELGSGVSTLVAAAALAANGDDGRIYSLDHDEAYARATSELLLQHGLSHIASVHHAPLEPWQPPRLTKLGKEWQWYSVPEAVNVLDAIDLLVVDGPPEGTGPLARYPAVPHFRDRLAPDGIVLLDDARRSNERAAAEAWSREDGLKLKLLLRPDREFEKGLAILAVNNEASRPI